MVSELDVIGAVTDHLERHLRGLGVNYTTIRNSSDPGRVIDFSVGPNYHGGKPLKQLYVSCQLLVLDGEVVVIYGGMITTAFQMADPEFPAGLERKLNGWFRDRAALRA